MALALRTLCGLSTREIARAFLEPEATTAQRLVRVQRKILDARIPYEVPSRELLPERLQAVLGVVYLVFNEGYASTERDGLVRTDLCAEAIRLGRLLVELMPEEPEAQGLLALMLLHDARRATRDRRRRRPDPARGAGSKPLAARRIAEGLAVLDAALRRRRRGPYQLQAAIAALHARGRARRRHRLGADRGSVCRPAERAAEPGGRAERGRRPGDGARPRARSCLDRRASSRAASSRDYHLLPAARADLLRRLGRLPEAALAYRDALVLVRSPAERLYLERRLAACAPGETG